jgi:uncharacterized protein (DUF427 family)
MKPSDRQIQDQDLAPLQRCVFGTGTKRLGHTPFEGNFYIRIKYLDTDCFSPALIPGLCRYKGIYHWLNLKLPDGRQE